MGITSISFYFELLGTEQKSEDHDEQNNDVTALGVKYRWGCTGTRSRATVYSSLEIATYFYSIYHQLLFFLPNITNTCNLLILLLQYCIIDGPNIGFLDLSVGHDSALGWKTVSSDFQFSVQRS